MSKVNQKRIQKTETSVKRNGNAAPLSRAKSIARNGISSSESYANLVNATLEDYLLETEQPDPKIIWSGVGKRIALFNAQVRAASLLSKGQKVKSDFFLTA